MKLLLQLILLVISISFITAIHVDSDIGLSTSSDQSKYIQFSEYNNEECSGEPVSTQTMINNYCYDKYNSFTCDYTNGNVVKNIWQNAGCSGLVRQLVEPMNQCEGRQITQCVDNIDIPSNAIVNYLSENCEDYKTNFNTLIVYSTSQCYSSTSTGEISFSCTANDIIVNQYPNGSTCTGTPISTTSNSIIPCEDIPGQISTTVLCLN